MIQKLRRKFILITMALVSIVLLAVFAGISLYYAASLRQDAYQALDMMANRPPGERGPNFLLGGGMPEGFGHEPMFTISLAVDGTAHLASADRVDVGGVNPQDIADAVLAGGARRGELTAYDLRYVLNDRGRETVIALMPMAPGRAQLQNVMLISGLLVAAALVVFFVASLLQSRWALRPVQQAWIQQKRFVADASHELKTPLTVILANTGILKSHPDSTIANQMTWIENTELEAGRLKGLVEDMLFLAKGDDTSIATAMQHFDLSETVNTTALTFEALAFEQGHSLNLNVESGIWAFGNASQIKQAAGILLDNAIKYSASGSEIQLVLTKRQDRAELSVTNTGNPITPAEKRHLFDRFYRADPSRAKQGYGLGLSIAETIVKRHSGKISVDSTADGTTFTISIPIK